mmetsp:Transcript_54074/g.152008  ORF Transcript_54074/g.152008 Transcript_54074/m.152008 type:complete len:401 (+) Transcript_54074:151-1353(+)
MGEEEYERLGKPIFGKVYTYDELLTVVRPTRPAAQTKAAIERHSMPRPDNWPSDTEVDRTSSWVFWLPEGWLQGIRTNPKSGLTLKCYFSPEGKRFWHKKDIEKHLGRQLPKVEIKEKAEEAAPKAYSPGRMRFVTDPDAIPSWPDDSDWLPKDWKVAYRQLPSGLHKCYIPPGVDDGFLYHKDTVLKWLRGEKPTLSPMKNSRPMSEIMKESAERHGRETTGELRPKAKRLRYAVDVDYKASSSLAVVRLPADAAESASTLRDAGAQSSQETAESAQEIHSLLLARGFEQPTLLAVARRDAEASAVLDAAFGIYFEAPAPFVGRPCYQRVRVVAPSRLVCSGMYLRWNERRQRWQFGALDGERDGVVISTSPDCATPWDVGHQWSVWAADTGEAAQEEA